MKPRSLNCFFFTEILFVLVGLLALNFPAALAQTTKKTSPPAAAKKSVARADEKPTSTMTTEQFNERLVNNILNAQPVAAGLEMWVVDRTSSKLSGFDTVTVKYSDGTNIERIQVLVSKDNRLAFLGQILDLTVDPFKENLKKMKLDNEPMLGNKNAPVTIVEFSDFECPMCGQAYQTLEKEVLKSYGDKIKLIYKNYPLPIHKWAESAAVAGLCAFEQKKDAFWNFYNGFFENQSTITEQTIRAKSVEIATQSGLNIPEFESCYDQKKPLPQIQADIEEGQALNLTGTPLFFIDGRPVAGAQPFPVFQKIIDGELKKLGS
ncbi:MAG: thioredoxin domain-containing protein [Acidobacteriia bacterium]|nr:thioredoxin domain-containing protein [Terriglobia bacterium]